MIQTVYLPQIVPSQHNSAVFGHNGELLGYIHEGDAGLVLVWTADQDGEDSVEVADLSAALAFFAAIAPAFITPIEPETVANPIRPEQDFKHAIVGCTCEYGECWDQYWYGEKERETRLSEAAPYRDDPPIWAQAQA